MIRNLFVLCLLFVGLSACSQTKKTTEIPVEAAKEVVKTEASKKKALDNSLLWRISGNGLEKESYLFGTIHIIDKESYFTPPGTLEAIDKSEVMVFEIDMKDMQDMSKMFSIMTKAYMADGLSLKDLVSEEDYQLVSDHFEAMGMPFSFLDKIKPMFLSMLGGDMDASSLQTGEMVSYEMKFFEMAESKGMETSGLESIEYQMSVFDSIPYKVQAEMLVETVKGGGATASGVFDEMIKLYLDQDIENLSKMIAEESEGMENFEDILVNRRNQNWISQIVELSSGKSAFYAVGAGHLGGKQGVIRLLRKEGYSVEPFDTSK